MGSCSRRADETFEQFRGRRKQENLEARAKQRGIFTPSVPTQRMVMNREAHVQMLEIARQELKAARKQGFTDKEIIEALKTGDESQKIYAQYIEFFILNP